MNVETIRHRPLRLHPLTVQTDGDELVIGRVDIDSYAVFPPEGAALIERLRAGDPLDEVGRWYEQTYGEPVDLADFVAVLDDLGFVMADNGTSATGDTDSFAAAGATGPGPAVAVPAGVRWQHLGRALFSPPAWAAFGALVALAVVACLRHPGLTPSPGHVFFSRYLLLIEIGVAVGQVPLILIHELFHLLAARRIGVNARIRMSHRLYYVVFETAMDGLVIVPRARRFLPILAGMVADAVLAALLTLAAWAASSWSAGPAPAVAGVCLALAFTTVVRFALQFVVFLRTDLYFLIATVFGCVDLHTTTRQLVRNRFDRLRRRPPSHDPAAWHPRDVRVARWYAPIHVAGYGLATVLLARVMAPISWRFLTTAVGAVAHHDPGSARFWDALGVIALNAGQPAAAGLLWLRERALAGRRRTTGRRPTRRRTAGRGALRSSPTTPETPSLR